MGEIATRSGKLDEGIAHFREALKIEDAGLYFEPPKWYYPIRAVTRRGVAEGRRMPRQKPSIVKT